MTATPDSRPVVAARTRDQIMFWIAVLALLFGFVWLFRPILLPFVLGTIIAYLLDPAVKAMRQRNIPRWAAALIILGTFVFFVGTLLTLLVPLAYREAVQLIDLLPQYIDRASRTVQHYSHWLQQHLRGAGISNLQDALQENISTAMQASGGLVLTLATGGKAILNMLYIFILTPIIAYLMMHDWPRMKSWLDDMVPRRSHEIVGDLWHRIDAKLSGFIRGQLILSFLLGLMYSIGLTVAGLNFGFLIGLMVGILSLIPLVGSTIGLITSLTVAWLQSEGELQYVAVIAGIFFACQFVEMNILTPRLLGKSVGLHPLWILFALTAGGTLFGIVGMLVAVPVAATAGVLIGYAIDRYKLSTFYIPPEQLAILIVTPDDVPKP